MLNTADSRSLNNRPWVVQFNVVDHLQLPQQPLISLKYTTTLLFELVFRNILLKNLRQLKISFVILFKTQHLR